MLTSCVECKGEMSDKAACCPKCGHPRSLESPPPVALTTPRGTSRNRLLFLLLLVGLAIVAGALVPGWVRDWKRSRLRESPSIYVRAGKWTRHDKGIINTYTRATSIEFRNTSEFDITDIEGKLTYLGASGDEMAIVPFKTSVLSGLISGQPQELRAGAEGTLVVVAGEISGYAPDVRVHVERVRVLN